MTKERPLNIIAEFKADGLEIDKSKIDDYNLQYKIEVKWSNKSVNNIEVYFNKNEENDKDILIKKIKMNITTRLANGLFLMYST